MTFAESARRAAGLAARLGWRADDFWAATPADLLNALGPAAEDALGGAELRQLMERDDGR
ncbi:phage tail assembly chaperone [Sphingosinicella soli]|uniref:Phage tail assembly chaperone n=1 Tax=Sphingosinicella soli TaxID=333708 RepID=A0A7W7B6A1_9SPHN|nr:phage tail assembly chaperone [Sphingosinicella soli]MBB4633662.1 hypothetical protein [Sphingosinicella soli]